MVFWNQNNHSNCKESLSWDWNGERKWICSASKQGKRCKVQADKKSQTRVRKANAVLLGKKSPNQISMRKARQKGKCRGLLDYNELASQLSTRNALQRLSIGIHQQIASHHKANSFLPLHLKLQATLFLQRILSKANSAVLSNKTVPLHKWRWPMKQAPVHLARLFQPFFTVITLLLKVNCTEV